MRLREALLVLIGCIMMILSCSKRQITPGEMILVQSGNLNIMGTYEPFVSWKGVSDENYSISLSPFYIGKYEVTQAEYESVMGYNPSFFSGNPNRPVERVSWFDAIEYCNRLSLLEDLLPVYQYGSYGTNPDDWPQGWNTVDANHTKISCDWSASGYLLPTVLEWIFAAKGGNESRGYRYSGSNNVNRVAWWGRNAKATTHPIGTKAPNELGIHDMSGNVWEWCWEIWDVSGYQSSPVTEPTGTESGNERSLRGGSSIHHAVGCAIYFNFGNLPTDKTHNSGLRVCRNST